MDLVVLLVRLALGAVFLISAVTKLTGLRQFVTDVRRYRVLPRLVSPAFAVTLPYVELGAAVFLLTGFYAGWAAVAVVVMLLSFMAAVGVVMFRGENLSCSCFGLLYRERVGWPTQVRDAFLLLLALFVLFADDGTLSLDSMLAGADQIESAIGLVLTAVVAGLSVAVSVLAAQESRSRASPALDHQPEAARH